MSPLPVVLVHGGGHGAWCWEPTIEHLASDVLAVDLPPKSIRGGDGRFDRPPELLTLTVSDFAESVLADVDAAGYDRFVLVGHSMAGLTIPEVARRNASASSSGLSGASASAISNIGLTSATSSASEANASWASWGTARASEIYETSIVTSSMTSGTSTRSSAPRFVRSRFTTRGSWRNEPSS